MSRIDPLIPAGPSPVPEWPNPQVYIQGKKSNIGINRIITETTSSIFSELANLATLIGGAQKGKRLRFSAGEITIPKGKIEKIETIVNKLIDYLQVLSLEGIDCSKTIKNLQSLIGGDSPLLKNVVRSQLYANQKNMNSIIADYLADLPRPVLEELNTLFKARNS